MVAPQPAHGNTVPTFSKHLPVFLKHSSWKPFPLKLQRLPHFSLFVMILEIILMELGTSGLNDGNQ